MFWKSSNIFSPVLLKKIAGLSNFNFSLLQTLVLVHRSSVEIPAEIWLYQEPNSGLWLKVQRAMVALEVVKEETSFKVQMMCCLVHYVVRWRFKRGNDLLITACKVLTVSL